MRSFVVAALLVTSCGKTLGEPAVDVPGRDASTPNGDASASPADGATPAPTFCTTRDAGAVFCDDFEQPGRTFSTSTPAPWSSFRSTDAGVASVGKGHQSAGGFRVAGEMSAGDRTRLGNVLEIAGKALRIELDLRVDGLLRLPPSLPQLEFATIAFPDDKRLALILYPYPPNTLTLGGFVTNQLEATPESKYFTDPPVVPSTGGGWFHITIEVDGRKTPAALRVLVGAFEVLTWTIILPLGPGLLEVGPDIRSEGASCDVTYDNVVVTQL